MAARRREGERREAVFVHRGDPERSDRLEVAVLAIVGDGGALEVWRLDIEHREVPGGPYVLGHHERQPVAVIGEPRADAPAGDRLPPVQDVALGELVARGLDDVIAGELRVRVEKCEAVLQLVAEAERPGRLVGGGAAPGAAGERLVERCRHHRVQTPVGRIHTDPVQPVTPGACGGVELGVDHAGLAHACDESVRLLHAFGLAEDERDLGGPSRLELERTHEGATVVVEAA